MKNNLDQQILDQLQILKETAEKIQQSRKELEASKETYQNALEEIQKATEEYQNAQEIITEIRKNLKLHKTEQSENKDQRQHLASFKNAAQEYQKAKALLEERHQLRTQVESKIEWMVENFRQFEEIIERKAEEILKVQLNKHQKELSILRFMTILMMIVFIIFLFFPVVKAIYDH
jgi:chromosome segregation ATPase